MLSRLDKEFELYTGLDSVIVSGYSLEDTVHLRIKDILYAETEQERDAAAAKAQEITHNLLDTFREAIEYSMEIEETKKVTAAVKGGGDTKIYTITLNQNRELVDWMITCDAGEALETYFEFREKGFATLTICEQNEDGTEKPSRVFNN